MKRKFLNILFALVLVCSFSLVTAVPAAADPDTLNVIPFTVNDDDLDAGSATWDTTQQHSGSSSVKLVNPDVTVDDNFAEVFFGVNIALGDIVLATTSFWAYSTDGDYIPYFIFEIPGTYPNSGVMLRINNDAEPSADFVGVWAPFVASESSSPLWQYEELDAEWNVEATGWKTWAELVNDYGTEIVNCVVVELSAITLATGDHTVYVDHVTISGTTYDLEGTATDYTTIQSAIDAAAEGDTISVAAGTYNTGSSESFPITVNTANLTIQAASSPVIDGGGNLGPGVHITADNVTFRGFTITNFTCTPAAGIGAMLVEGDGAIIDTNIIYDITTQLDPINEPAGIGIDVHASNVEVTNNIVHDVGSIGIRIRHDWDTPPTVSNNVLLENNKVYRTANSGVLVTGYAKGVTIRQNEIYESLEPTPYSLLVHYGASDVLIENNNIHDPYDSTVGHNVVLAGCDNVTISGNTIVGATLGKNIYVLSDYGIWVDAELLSTNINIISNDIQNGKWGVRLAGTFAADPSQMAATTTINLNNISGNTDYGVENTIATDVDAENNWWGNASGPSGTPAVLGYDIGYGDNVSANVDFEPWLLEVVVTGVPPTTYEKTLALKDGWTLVSTNKEVTTGTTSVEPTLTYTYTPVVGYAEATAADLEPVSALYVKTSGGGGVGINYATGAPGVSSKDLAAGWNLISSATETDAGAVLSPLRYVAGEEAVALATLVSQGNYNQFTAAWYIDATTWTNVSGTMNPFDGYWVYMNAAKSFGVIPD